MKMRKLFAILVASALLAALAIVPTSAAYTINYTVNRTFTTAADLGNLNPEGGATVEDGAIVIPANKYILEGFEANTYNAMELTMAVTAGSATVRLGKTSSSSFQVKVTATDYTIYTDNPTGGAFQRTITSGDHEGEVVFSYIIDKANNKAVFTVNGDEYVLDAVVTESDAIPLVNAGPLDNSFTNWAGFGLFADATGNVAVSSIKLGTAESSVVQSGEHDVTVTVNPTDKVQAPTEYLVDIAFGDFAFTYNVVNIIDDESNLLKADGEWVATTDTVVVTNNTDTTNDDGDVWVTASYAPVANAVPGVTFELDNTNANKLAPNDDVTITGTIGGAPTDTRTELTAVKLGTITIVVDSVDPAA